MRKESLFRWKSAVSVLITVLLMLILVSPVASDLGASEDAGAPVGQTPQTPAQPPYRPCSGPGCECRPASDLGQYPSCPGHENYVCGWDWNPFKGGYDPRYCLQVSAPTTTPTPTTPEMPEWQPCPEDIPNCNCLRQYVGEDEGYQRCDSDVACMWDWSGHAWLPYYCYIEEEIPPREPCPEDVPGCNCLPSEVGVEAGYEQCNSGVECDWGWDEKNSEWSPSYCFIVEKPSETPPEPEFKPCTEPGCECLPIGLSAFYPRCPGQEDYVCGYDVDDSGVYHQRVCLEREGTITMETPPEPEYQPCEDEGCECLPLYLSEFYPRCPGQENYVCGWDVHLTNAYHYPRVCLRVPEIPVVEFVPRPTITKTCPTDVIYTVVVGATVLQIPAGEEANCDCELYDPSKLECVQSDTPCGWQYVCPIPGVFTHLACGYVPLYCYWNTSTVTTTTTSITPTGITITCPPDIEDCECRIQGDNDEHCWNSTLPCGWRYVADNNSYIPMYCFKETTGLPYPVLVAAIGGVGFLVIFGFWWRRRKQNGGK